MLVITSFYISKYPAFALRRIYNVLKLPHLNLQWFDYSTRRKFLLNSLFYSLLVYLYLRKGVLQMFSRFLYVELI